MSLWIDTQAFEFIAAAVFVIPAAGAFLVFTERKKKTEEKKNDLQQS